MAEKKLLRHSRLCFDFVLFVAIFQSFSCSDILIYSLTFFFLINEMAEFIHNTFFCSLYAFFGP